MAKKVTVTLVDDFDGEGPADETVEFSIDGVSYEIDLSAGNAKKIREDFKQWIDAGRRVGGRTRAGLGRHLALAEARVRELPVARDVSGRVDVGHVRASRVVRPALAVAPRRGRAARARRPRG